MIEIKSKFIKKDDILYYKPEELRNIKGLLTVVYRDEHETKMFFETENIAEYFLNKNRTFIHCAVNPFELFKTFGNKLDETEEDFVNRYSYIVEKYFYDENSKILALARASIFREELNSDNYELYFAENGEIVLNFVIDNKRNY